MRAKSSRTSFYAVASGRKPGVYLRWGKAKQQVDGFAGSKYKKFDTNQDAIEFIRLHSTEAPAIQQAEQSLFDTNLSSPIPERWNHSHLPLKQIKVESVSNKEFVAFCDGSALGNGQEAAKAGWACVFPNKPQWTTSSPLTGVATNNRAEYTAALEAIKRANEEDPTQSKPLHIFSDSNLLIKSMTEWIQGWVASRWKKSNGKPVLNDDLLKDILANSGKRSIIWTQIPAHTGNTDWFSVYNDQADQLAKQAAAKYVG